MVSSEASCEYAVVGGGPAGALAARTLAERGRAVVLLDWRPRDEKPCGGGVPAHGMARFGSLLDGTPRNETRAIRLVGPGGDAATIALATPLAIFARSEFDEALRGRAEAAGARRVAARATGLARTDGGFTLELRRRADAPPETLAARFVVAADGAAGATRRRLLELAGLAPPPAAHFSRSHTIYPAHAHGEETRVDTLEIAWVRGVDGYGWSFPRRDHASLGWCAQGPARGEGDLRRTLDALVAARALSGPTSRAGGVERGVGALIPSYRGEVARDAVVEGRGFALVGDAAGAVDPITREGIHHALASGAALGDADPLAHPGRYAAWYDAELRPELVAAAGLAPRFFGPTFLTTMVRTLDRNEALRDVFRDLVAGTQSYRTLRRRLLACLPRALAALVVATLRR
jgi:geranylgeranyl reductase